jgi:hypothetical protein
LTTVSETAEVVIGEVHTALLQNSTAVSAATTTALLALTTGERVRQSERPIAYAVSPARFTGVDCELPAVAATGTQASARVRAVGTVTSRAVLTGGHVLQGSTFARITPADSGHRQPWSHYLARPGVLELVGRSRGLDVAGGHLLATSHPDLLDLGAIGNRTVDEVQSSGRIDRRAPFRTERTSLRWAVSERGGFEFRLVNATARTARLPGSAAGAEAVAVLCEDIALHDWLLTTLLSLVSRNPARSAERRQVVERLAPAADYLLHLWMPAARVDAVLAPIWHGIEQRPGMTRQWQTNVDRVRDQLALAVIEASVRRP